MENSGAAPLVSTAREAHDQSAAALGTLPRSALSEFSSPSGMTDETTSGNERDLSDVAAGSNGGVASHMSALPATSTGNYGVSAGHGLFGSNFLGLSSAPPVRWDSANSTDFHKFTAHTMWSSAPGQLAGSSQQNAGNANGSLHPHQQQQQQQQQSFLRLSSSASCHGFPACDNPGTGSGHGGCSGICSGGSSAALSSPHAFAAGLDSGQSQELPPLSLPQGLQAASFLQQPQLKTAALQQPQQSLHGGSVAATPGNSFGSGAGALSAAGSSAASPLGLFPLCASGPLHRCASIQPTGAMTSRFNLLLVTCSDMVVQLLCWGPVRSLSI